MIFKGRNRVTQPYTYNAAQKSGHGGIDIVGDDNTTVYSVCNGTVTMVSKWDGKTKTGTQSYGNLVVVTASNGYRYYYAHLQSISVSKGAAVHIGTKIGVMGNTGNSFGAHTHFEIRTGTTTSTRINPSSYAGVQNTKGTYNESAAATTSTSTSTTTTTTTATGRAYAHAIGEHVVFSTCYKSSTAPSSDAIDAAKMSRNHGVITKRVDAANPYLLDNGLCWVNDGDIRGLYAAAAAKATTTNSTKYKITCNWIYKRKKANSLSATCGKLHNGDIVNVVSWSGNWAKLDDGTYSCIKKYSTKV